MTADIEHLAVSRDIAASPEAVYAAIADVTRMGEWSDECVGCEWIDGATGAEVGAHFLGHNAHGEHRWTTKGRVAVADPGRRFVFECLSPDFDDFHFSTWGYELEPTDGGCRVTETWDDLRPAGAKDSGKRFGIEDRVAKNRQSMATTLERIATAVEG